MTFREAKQLCKTYNYVTTEGDTLTSICYNLFHECTENQVKMLYALNDRFDWENLPGGENIMYLSNEDLNKVEEI